MQIMTFQSQSFKYPHPKVVGHLARVVAKLEVAAVHRANPVGNAAREQVDGKIECVGDQGQSAELKRNSAGELIRLERERVCELGHERKFGGYGARELVEGNIEARVQVDELGQHHRDRAIKFVLWMMVGRWGVSLDAL